MKSKKLICTFFLSLFAIIAVFSPLALYFSVFHTGFSSKSSDWGEFGSYASGTVGSLLSAASLIALILTLYRTSRDNRETQTIAIKALEKTQHQIVLMERQLKIQIFDGYVEGLNQVLANKKYTNHKGDQISRDEFLDDAHHRLAVSVWARMSNSIIENRRSFDCYLPSIILREMNFNFKEAHRIYRFVLDFYISCDENELRKILIRHLLTKTDIDVLSWLAGDAYIHMRELLSAENSRLFLISDEMTNAILLGEKHAKEVLGPPKRTDESHAYI